MNGVGGVSDKNAQDEHKCDNAKRAFPLLCIAEKYQVPKPRVDDKSCKTAPEGDAAYRKDFGKNDGRRTVGHKPQKTADQRLIPVSAPLKEGDDGVLDRKSV